MSRQALIAALALVVVGVVSVAAAQVPVNVNIGPPPPPIVLPAPPALVVVPGVTIVKYAPSAGMDLFFHENRWYYSHGGYWYGGPSYRGPWMGVPFAKLPPPIVAVPVKYYKVPPGHLKQLDKGG